MTRILLINELTLFYLLFCAMTGREVWVLTILPIFPPLRRILDFIVVRLVGRGRIDYALNHCPELDRTRDYPIKITQFDVFADIEPWMNNYFRFSEIGTDTYGYGLSYKKIISNYINTMLQPLLILKILHQKLAIGTYRVIGLPKDLRAAAQFYAGEDMVFSPDLFGNGSKFYNACQSGLLTTYALAWALVKLRPFGFRKERYFFAVDYIHDNRDDELLEEIKGEGPQLIVLRQAASEEQRRKLPENRNVCSSSDGAFGLIDGIKAMMELTRDGWVLWRQHNKCPSAVYFQIATLSHRRNKARAFFNRFAVEYFWGRDPYNVEHILRRYEINRIGGKSMGVSVSFLTTSAILWPQFRYLNYDIYYVFERPIVEKYYSCFWPDDMKLVAAGSGLISRELLSRRTTPRACDIVVFCGVFAGEPEMLSFIRGLGEAFPDRKILLQLKPFLLKTKGGKQFVSDCIEGLSNIEHRTDSPYELILQARYAISDPSSLVAEALQLGSVAFGFDIPKKQRSNVIRLYSGLALATAKEAALRIKGLESGDGKYDLKLYGDLVDLSGVAFNDRAREDMGLGPIQTPQPLTSETLGITA